MEKNGSESAFPEHTAKMMNEIFLFLSVLLKISEETLIQISVRPVPEDCTYVFGSYYLLNYLQAAQSIPKLQYTYAFYSTSTSSPDSRQKKKTFVDERDEDLKVGPPQWTSCFVVFPIIFL